MVLPNSGVTMTISKSLFCGIAYSKDIAWVQTKRGKRPRTEDAQVKFLDLLVEKLDYDAIKSKTREVIDYLNMTEGLIQPITQLEVEGITI